MNELEKLMNSSNWSVMLERYTSEYDEDVAEEMINTIKFDIKALIQAEKVKELEQLLIGESDDSGGFKPANTIQNTIILDRIKALKEGK